MVVGLRNVPIANVLPNLNQVLMFDGLEWVPTDLPEGPTGTVDWDSGATTWSNPVIDTWTP
jgi:hypothetical protein